MIGLVVWMDDTIRNGLHVLENILVSTLNASTNTGWFYRLA